MVDKNSGVWSMVSGGELKRELTQRSRSYLYKTAPPSQRADLESEGWQLDRRNKKSIRLKRLKPTGQALEDHVWTLLASMGFCEMNQGRQFKIPIGSAPPKQIDVFAKDDLSALVVSCKENSRYGPLSLQEELESLNGLRTRIAGSIRTHYDQTPPHFTGFVLATRNVHWSSPDLDRAKEYGIRPLRDEELGYFGKLTDLIGTAARYQLMGELFQGSPIPRMAAKKVAAIRGRYKNTQFYQFVIDPETLARISFVQHRARIDRDGRLPYQRMVQKSRLAAIAKYINSGAVFPTNIVINFSDPTRRIVFEQAAKSEQASDDLVVGKLILPNTFKSAWIIDGQHRLYGYFNKLTEEGHRHRSQLPVLAFEDLPPEDEASLFVDINTNQKRVNRNLLHELNAELNLGSADARKHFAALITLIVLGLNTRRQSPLFGWIKSEQASKSEAFLTLDSIQTAISRSSLVGMVHTRSRLFVPGPLYGRDDSSAVERSIDIIASYLRLFSDGAEKHWNLENRRNSPDRPGGYLLTNLGVSALIGLLSTLVEYLGKTYDLDFEGMDTDEFVQSVEAYCKPVIDYFQNPSYEGVQQFRRYLGAGAPRHGMMQMQLLIRTADPTYSPNGLDDYLREQEEEEIKALNEIYRPLEADLLDVIVHTLRQKFGERWFTDGVPLKVKTEVIAEQDKDKSKSYEQCFTLPTHAKLIMQANSPMFQAVLQTGDLKWLDKLIEVRNGISHAPYKIEPHYRDFLVNVVRRTLNKGKQNMDLAL